MVLRRLGLVCARWLVDRLAACAQWLAGRLAGAAAGGGAAKVIVGGGLFWCMRYGPVLSCAWYCYFNHRCTRINTDWLGAERRIFVELDLGARGVSPAV